MSKQTLDVYRQHLNLHDATFTKIEHEDAIVATVDRVTMPNGTNYILKICLLPRHYERELYFLKHFANQIPVPRIIDHVPPSESINGAILMEYFPGNILKKEDLTESMAFEIGSILAKIHSNRTPGYGDLFKPDSLTNNPREAFIEKFENHLAECATLFPQHLVKQCEQYLQDHLALLDSVDGPCIVHWDFRPGNIMALNGTIQGIIDWSSSRSDFAEEDFCPMEHQGWANAPAIREAFFAGYSTIRPVPEYERIMPLLRLSKALSSMGFAIRLNTWNRRNAEFYEMNRKFVEEMFK